MKKKTKLIIVASVITTIAIVCAGIMIYRYNYYKTHWDTRERVSKELRDCQSYWICNGRLLKGMNGFFIIGSERDWNAQKLCFWDGKSKEYDIVCKKPNCKHSSENCSAWFGANSYNFQYSNDYIFYIDWDKDGDEWLYRCETDGTNRVPMLRVTEHNIDTIVYDIKVHGNHILVAKGLMYDERTEISMIDYDMSDKDIKEYEVAKCGGNRITIYDVLGNKVLYGIDDDKSTDMYEYDIKTKENVKLRTVEDIAGFANYVDGGIAFTYQGKAVLYKDGKEILLNEGDGNQIGCDGKYLYVDNAPMFSHDEEENKLKHIVMVFDFEGKLLHTIDMPDNSKEKMQVCYFGDGEQIFVSNFTDDEIFVINIEDYKNGTWNEIKRCD